MSALKTLQCKLQDQHGISLHGIARRTGYDVTVLSRVFNGHRRFNVSLARTLSDTFNLSDRDRGWLLSEVDSFQDAVLTREEKRVTLATLNEGLPETVYYKEAEP